MLVWGLRCPEPHGQLHPTLPWPASLILPASTPGTVGPRSQGRPHRLPPYWRGALSLSAAWTNPEPRLIPSIAPLHLSPSPSPSPRPHSPPRPKQVPCILHSNGLKDTLSYLEPHISRDAPLWSVFSMAAQRSRPGYEQQHSGGGREWRPFRLKKELGIPL